MKLLYSFNAGLGLRTLLLLIFTAPNFGAYAPYLLMAQTNQALEFAAGDGNPTGNGPVTGTTIRFRNNTNNPTGNTFATYNPAVGGPLTMTATLTEQQYNFAQITPNAAVVFGLSVNGGASIFPLHSGNPGAPNNSDFTGSGSTIGGGIDVNQNTVINVFNVSTVLRNANVPTNQRVQMADLVLTFNRPVKDPILHIQGLGAFFGDLNFTPEFNLLSSNVPVTLSKLSGSTGLVVQTVGGIQQINNPNPIALTGQNSGKGSIQITGDGISSITFRVFLRGDGNGTAWAANAIDINGDGWGFSFSLLESDLRIAKTVNISRPAIGENVISTVTATNNGPSNSTGVQVQDLLPSGYTYVSHTVSAGGGTYTPGTGLWNIGNLNNGASRTLTIIATVNGSGNYTNVASISGDNSDPNLTNNVASVATQPLIPFTNACDANTIFLSQDEPFTSLRTIDFSTTPASYPLITTSGIQYNAIGFNTQNNLIYGFKLESAGSNVLVVFDASGQPVELGSVAGLPLGFYVAADFDADGYLWVLNNVSSVIYKVNVNTRSVVVSRSVNKQPNTNATRVADIGYDVITGEFFGVTNTNYQLVRINQNTGGWTNIGSPNLNLVLSPHVAVGAMYTDGFGNIYGVRNSGGFYQFNRTTGVATLISNAPSSVANDGAMCHTSTLTFDADIQVEKTVNSEIYLPGTNVVYTIVVTNAGPFGAANVRIEDPLIPGIPAANYSYTASVLGGATTTVSGTQTGAIDDLVNLPVGGTVTYTLTVSVPSGFTGPLINTVTATPPANINDTDLTNNEASVTTDPLVPFVDACDANRIFLSQDNQLRLVDRSTNPLSFPVIGSSGFNYNAIGLNPVDNLIYGIRRGTNNSANPRNRLIVIGANGVATTLGEVAGLPNFSGQSYFSAVFDADGKFWVLNDNNSALYRINVQTVAVELTIPVTNNGNRVTDIAYDMISGNFWGVNDNTWQLVSLNPTTGVMTNVGTPNQGNSAMGAMYSDALGNVYGAANTGGFYQFDPITGRSTLIADSPESDNNDGTMCITSILEFAVDVTVEKTVAQESYLIGEEAVFTVTVQNDGPFGASGVSVTDLVPSGIATNNVTFTVETSGNATSVYAPNITYTGAIEDYIGLPFSSSAGGSSVVYTIRINTTGFSGTLENIVRVEMPTSVNNVGGQELEAEAETEVITPPTANDDESLGNPSGQAVTIDVVGNDNQGGLPFDAASLQVVGTANAGDDLVVVGEGVWSVDLITGEITFTPEPGFVGNPTPIQYTISDTQGNVSNPATVTVTYIVLPVSIIGAVFNDINGNTINESGESFASLPSPLFVYLVDGSGVIVDSAQVASNGSYTLLAPPNQNYTIELSQVQYAIGSNVNSTPIDNTPPAWWFTIGENGNNNTGTGDGQPNGILSVQIGTTNVSNQNFALAPIPVVHNKSFEGIAPNSLVFLTTGNSTYPYSMPLSETANSVNTSLSTVDGSLPGRVSGFDYNAGNVVGSTSSTPLTFVTNGVLLDPSTNLPLNNSVIVYTFGGVGIILNPNPSSSDDSYQFWNPSKGQYEIPDFNFDNFNVWFDVQGQTGFYFEYGWINQAGVQSGSATYLVNASGPLVVLPVELTTFNAIRSGNNALLNWFTASEVNNAGFEVQHSKNGVDFKVLAWLNGTGTSSVFQKYQYTHYDLDNGVHYYRLKQVDFNGQFEYSKIVSVSVSKSPAVELFPNPTSTFVNLKNTTSYNALFIHDAFGRVLREVNLNGENFISLTLDGFSRGIYFVVLTKKDGTKTVKEFIVQ